jgi:hypothetical protein
MAVLLAEAVSLDTEKQYRYRKAPEFKFWDKVLKRGENDCWPWNAGVTPDGYGRIKWRLKPWPAHRLAYYLVYKELPEMVSHSCHAPDCCNPKHLYGRDRKVKNVD